MPRKLIIKMAYVLVYRSEHSYPSVNFSNSIFYHIITRCNGVFALSVIVPNFAPLPLRLSPSAGQSSHVCMQCIVQKGPLVDHKKKQHRPAGQLQRQTQSANPKKRLHQHSAHCFGRSPPDDDESSVNFR